MDPIVKSVERHIRQIELCLQAINNPRRCGSDYSGQPRKIAPNAKVREAKNLADKICETQKLIDQLDEPTARYVYQGFLDEAEQVRREIISPAILLVEDCNC